MLKDALREKSDVFNSENSEEDKVCMHQTYHYILSCVICQL
jgi:hypothetical protein